MGFECPHGRNPPVSRSLRVLQLLDRVVPKTGVPEPGIGSPLFDFRQVMQNLDRNPPFSFRQVPRFGQELVN
ncbi:MAG TPA: hypothetical protein DCS07_16005 [Bdellovibrionales bacterium]|nr:hypothetical protein [Bdellovibrionales bacterium]